MTTAPQIRAILRIHFVVRSPRSSRVAIISPFFLGTAPTRALNTSHTCWQGSDHPEHSPGALTAAHPGPWQKSQGVA